MQLGLFNFVGLYLQRLHLAVPILQFKMGEKRKGVLPNACFKKHLENYVHTWYDQPGKKAKQRTIRNKKALAVSPSPVAGTLHSDSVCSSMVQQAREKDETKDYQEQLAAPWHCMPGKMHH